MDKAYGMKRLAEMTGIALEEMIFVGDRLDPEGNDYPVKALGVPCQAVSGWQDTVAYVTPWRASSPLRRTAVRTPPPRSRWVLVSEVSRGSDIFRS